MLCGKVLKSTETWIAKRNSKTKRSKWKCDISPVCLFKRTRDNSDWVVLVIFVIFLCTMQQRLQIIQAILKGSGSFPAVWSYACSSSTHILCSCGCLTEEGVFSLLGFGCWVLLPFAEGTCSVLHLPPTPTVLGRVLSLALIFRPAPLFFSRSVWQGGSNLPSCCVSSCAGGATAPQE